MSSRQAAPRSYKKTSAKKVAKKPSYSKARKSIRKATTTKSMRYPGAGARLGSAIGSAFGPVGSVAGAALGGLAHQAIHALTGFGDYSMPNYEIKTNSLLGMGDPPRIENAGKEFVVRHREYLGDVYSGVAGAPGAPAPSPFALVSYPINPGINQTFPWLANVASRFEEYTIEGAAFEYRSLYSDAAVQTGGSLGAVIMATEYNAAKPVFANKIEMENYEFASSCKPSVSMLHPIECTPHQTPLTELYIRQPTTDLTNQDIKTYDLGKFQIATQGIPVSGSPLALGELWLTYQVRLFKPRVSNYVDSGYELWSTLGDIQPSGGVFISPGSVWYPSPYNNIGVVVDNIMGTFKVPLYSNEREYFVICDVRDPSNGVSQSSAIGYFSTADPTAVNGNIYLPLPSGTSDRSLSTRTAGSLITSGTSLMFSLRTKSLSPGNTHCTVSLPTGTGAGQTVVKSLLLNAIPVDLRG